MTDSRRASTALVAVGAIAAAVLVSRSACSCSGVLRRTGWLPRATLALTADALLAFAISDPDRRIAVRDLDRYEETGDPAPARAAGRAGRHRRPQPGA
jgi:hypothetical protein